MIRLAAVTVLVLAFSAGAANARGADHGGGGHDGGGDVRVAGVCGAGASASLRVRTRDDGIELRFQLRQTRKWGSWRVTVVHENRVASRTSSKTTRADDNFELRRTLPDLPGSDTVVVTAWGPNGLGCRAAATLAGG